MTVFKHELTHSFQVTDPEAYAEYKKYVIDKLQAYNPEIYKEHFNSLWEKYCKQYNADTRNGRIIKTVKNENGTVNYVTDKNGMFVYDGEKRVTAADIEDEIAARATESFLTDEKGIAFQKMADKNPNAAKGFINALRSMILRLVQFSQQLKKRFAGAFNTKAETEMLRADINTFREAERMFTDMLEERYNANPNNAKTPYTDKSAAANTEIENERPKQLFKDYSAVTESILNVSDKAAKEYADNRIAVEVSDHTPDVILNNVEGAKDLRIIMNYAKLYLAVRKDGVFKGHYHNLGAETAKKLPDILANPDAIIQLGNGRLNIFSTIKTDKGNNGIISVELNSTKDIEGKYQDYNVVVTMFSSDDKYVKNLLSGENVDVKYKKEDLSQVNPQLYKWLAIINDKSSSDNSISQDSNTVNSSIREDVRSDTKHLKGEGRAVIKVINDNSDKISNQSIFDVSTDTNINKFKNKSDYVLNIFNAQGNTAYNPHIGAVELSKSGAKSTILHGFGKEKLAAAKAIKRIIEKGNIIEHVKNYNNGVDRYIVAAVGTIDGEKAIAGVVIKSYPQQNHNSKFYLHEAEIIKTDLSFMTAPQLSVDTVDKSASDNSISQDDNTVNSSIRKDVRNDTSDVQSKYESAKFNAESHSVWSAKETAMTDELFAVNKEVADNFSNQVDKWLGGNMKSDEYFQLGKTPVVLQKLGAEELTVVMSKDVMAKITGLKHDISTDEIKNIPQAISDPIMVFKSATVNNAFVVLTELKDKHGDDVVAAIHMNKKQRHIFVNRISSVYGKRNAAHFVENQFRIGNVKYMDKIKSQNWSQSRGLQLPKLADTNPDNNIILYKNDIVNSYRMQKTGNNANISPKKNTGIKSHRDFSELHSKYTEYTYKALTHKKDMNVTLLGSQNIYDESGKIDRHSVLNKAMENVKSKNNPKNTADKNFVYIPDIGRDVLVGRKGLSHGLSRNANLTALVTTKIGDIVENSIKVNELKPRNNTSGGYILLGIAKDNKNNYYPVRIVVNNYAVDDVEILDVLYAVNAKKKSQFSNETELPANAVPPIKDSSTISIADLLETVKDKFSDVLTDDVLNNAGVKRGKSSLSESVVYKDIADNDKTSRWTTKRIEGNSDNNVNIADIVNSIRDKFNIPIATGKVTDREASGIYKEKPETIRTRIANNLPTISHELGHHLNKKYRLEHLESVEELQKDLGFEPPEGFCQENFNKLLLEKDESLVYACLSLRPKSMEELLKKTGFAMPQMADILQRLIQKDFITESFKNYYIRKI